MDAAFKSRPFPGYTTAQLVAFVESNGRDGYTMPYERFCAMRAEIARRAELDRGDFTNATPGERLRAATKPEPFHTEPTPIGNQYVIPGCEKDKSRGPAQADLF